MLSGLKCEGENVELKAAKAMAAASSSPSTASSSSLSARALSSHSIAKLPSQHRRQVRVPLLLPSCRLRLISTSLSAWKHRPSFTHRAAQNEEAKVLNEQQEDTKASDSECESADEENDAPGVETMLKKYREALSSNNEDAMKELEAQFEQLEKEKVTYTERVSTLNAEVLLLKDRLLRLNADFENFRKRSEKERINASSNVKADVVNSLLPMVDNFERAKTQLKIETEGEQQIDNSYQNIYKQFVEIMKGLGVSVVETVGKEFDPNVHEAIMREESSQYPEGLVIEEFRRGFMLGEKLLRPAMVKVSSGASITATPDPVAAAEGAEGAAAGVSELVEEAAE